MCEELCNENKKISIKSNNNNHIEELDNKNIIYDNIITKDVP